MLDDDTIVRMHRGGLSVRQIALAGVAAEHVERVLRARGVDVDAISAPPSPGARHRAILDAIRVPGRTYASVGADFGVSKQRVAQIARQNGVRRNGVRRTEQPAS